METQTEGGKERGNTATCGTSVDGGDAPARREAEAGLRWISLPRVLLSLLVREGEGREEEGVGEAMNGSELRRREVAAAICKEGCELSLFPDLEGGGGGGGEEPREEECGWGRRSVGAG